ncbi:MAG: peptidoglycan editing factor PgeF [Desulfuromonadales bacterium]|nr:peptidoglycan editing factor PgeF [Desulfuromonadales bacterium]NIR33872.1 peptidoglycan editing factor PgeF [Desulfuromonadales bacterium]NIS40023.1 peptidoglycan editing factor PgeF [Desulfuromonadales bacterium]
MKLVRKGKISYKQPSWAERFGLAAGFTTRNGGVSRPPYNSLNLAFNTDDPSSNVEGNRSTLARAFNLPVHMLLTVKQVHGTGVLVLDEPNPDLTHFLSVECDAVVTDQPGLMIGILVADCYPVLLFDPGKKVFAAVHVGWRGAAEGILGKTARIMEENFDVRIEELYAAVGPGIGAHKYEVDRPVREAFRRGSDHWQRIAEERSLGKWLLDLRLSCQLQLRDAGLDPARIEAVEECSCCHKELFFSYRRDGGTTGRQMGFVVTG